MFKWKNEYELGVELSDEQHKKLFEIGNRAYELLKSEFYVDKYNKIVEIIEELKDYAVLHFNDEEEYMLKIGYKKFISHKVEHDNFIKKVGGVDLSKIDHNQDEAIKDILEFVYNWISNHILIRDREYSVTPSDI